MLVNCFAWNLYTSQDARSANKCDTKAGASIPPIAMTQPLALLSPFLSLLSLPLFNMCPGLSPPENVGIKVAFKHKHQHIYLTV